VDAFVYDTEINAIQVWAGITLGGVSFLSSALAFHFRLIYHPRIRTRPTTLADYLKPFGLKLVADFGNAFYQEQYLQTVGRVLVMTEGERVANVVVE
jgi:hypothetical protein